MLQLKKLMRKMNISKGIYLLSDSGGRMLKVTLFETLVRGIPEALTMMLAMKILIIYLKMYLQKQY